MIERPTVVRASHAAARSWSTGAPPGEAPARTPSDHGRPVSSDRPRSPLRPMAPGTMFIPLRSELRRCSTKGCVFPASAHGTGKCWHHELEELEPTHFLSRQPTQLVLDRAKFGLPDEEWDSSGARDRRRLAALREQFIEDVA
jgi:hypothetical protein